MRINYKKGNNGKGDRIILMTTNENEPFTIFKLALATNQLAVNELTINKDKIEKYGNFLFEKAITDSITMAKKGIDWGLEENKEEVIKWCKKHFLKFEPVEQELRRCYQTKLGDYGVGRE